MIEVPLYCTLMVEGAASRWRVLRVHLAEEPSAPFELTLDLACGDADHAVVDLEGRRVTASMVRGERLECRHGHVTRFQRAGRVGGEYLARVRVGPELPPAPVRGDDASSPNALRAVAVRCGPASVRDLRRELEALAERSPAHRAILFALDETGGPFKPVALALLDAGLALAPGQGSHALGFGASRFAYVVGDMTVVLLTFEGLLACVEVAGFEESTDDLMLNRLDALDLAYEPRDDPHVLARRRERALKAESAQVLTRLHAERAARLCPMGAVTWLPAVADAAARMTSLTAALPAVREICGCFSAVITPTGEAVATIKEADADDALRYVLRGPNPGGRVVAAEALADRNTLTAEDARALYALCEQFDVDVAAERGQLLAECSLHRVTLGRGGFPLEAVRVPGASPSRPLPSSEAPRASGVDLRAAYEAFARTPPGHDIILRALDALDAVGQPVASAAFSILGRGPRRLARRTENPALGFGAFRYEFDFDEMRAVLVAFDGLLAGVRLTSSHALVQKIKSSFGTTPADPVDPLGAKSPEIMAMLHAARAECLGPMSPGPFPPPIAGAVRTLTSLMGPALVLETSEWARSRPRPEAEAVAQLVTAGAFDALSVVLRGPNPGGRVLAAQALAAHDALSSDDLRALEVLRELYEVTVLEDGAPVPECLFYRRHPTLRARRVE